MSQQQIQSPVNVARGGQFPAFFTWLAVGLLVYSLLIGVGVIGAGFKWVSGGAEGAEAIFAFASNPVVGVIVGVLATALVQSSSTVTSIIVGLVAGGVPVSIAVPMIMGANMGTTITNTIVSLGSLGERETFRRCFQAATVHDFFNLFSILIFLPIEIMFHPLERMAGGMATWFSGSGGASVDELNFIGAATKPVVNLIVDQPDRASGRGRSALSQAGVPVHAGRQYRYLYHGVARGDRRFRPE